MIRQTLRIVKGRDEAGAEGFDIHDIEYGILTGKVRRTWPREEKYEVVGRAFDGRAIGLVCRRTSGNRLCIITVYEDLPKE